MTTIIAFHFPHKAASMFAFQILKKISEEYSVKLCSQNNIPPNHGEIANLKAEDSDIILRGPVRNFTIVKNYQELPEDDYRFFTPKSMLVEYEYKAIFQTRDILDLIVSKYFSQGWIHPPLADGMPLREDLQAGRLGMYDYAILELDGRTGFAQDSIVNKMKELSNFKKIHSPKLFLSVSYEEMVMDYSSWSRKIGNFISKDFPEIHNILHKMQPKYRDPQNNGEFFSNPLDYVEKYGESFEHVRSPYPGDYRRFLSPDQVAGLRAMITSALG
jgi:hypothetical protein